MKCLLQEDYLVESRIRLYSDDSSWMAYEYSAYLLSGLISDIAISVDRRTDLVSARVDLDSFLKNGLGDYLYLINEGVCELSVPFLTLMAPFVIWRKEVLEKDVEQQKQ